MGTSSFNREETPTRTEFDNLPGMTETFRDAERKRNAGKPGFDSFGKPAPTTFGALGGATTPPAVTLSRQEAEGERILAALSERFDWNKEKTEDDEQLNQLRDRFGL